MTAADTYPTWPDVLQWHTVSGPSPDNPGFCRFTYDDGTLQLSTEVLVPRRLAATEDLVEQRNRLAQWTRTQSAYYAAIDHLAHLVRIRIYMGHDPSEATARKKADHAANMAEDLMGVLAKDSALLTVVAP